MPRFLADPNAPPCTAQALAGQPTVLEDGGRRRRAGRFSRPQNLLLHKLGETTDVRSGTGGKCARAVALALAAEADVTRGNQDDSATASEWRRDP